MLALILINHIGILLIMVLIAFIIGLIKFAFKYVENQEKNVIYSKSVKQDYIDDVLFPIIFALVIFFIFELFYWICKIFF